MRGGRALRRRPAAHFLLQSIDSLTRRPPSVQGVFAKPEAQVFADVARSRNVPDDAILIEDQSTPLFSGSSIYSTSIGVKI